MHKTFFLALFLMNYTMSAQATCFFVITPTPQGNCITLQDGDQEERFVSMTVQCNVPNSTESEQFNDFLNQLIEDYQIPAFAQVAFLAYLEGNTAALDVTIEDEESIELINTDKELVTG